MPNSLKSLLSDYVAKLRERGAANGVKQFTGNSDLLIANELDALLSRAPIAEGGGDGEYSQGVMGDGAAEKHEGATRRRNSHFKGDGLMPAYHETHDAPHCPTCDCGVESLSRQGATRASESGDSFDKYDMHVTDDGAVVFTHNGKTAAIYNPIAAAPAPGGG